MGASAPFFCAQGNSRNKWTGYPGRGLIPAQHAVLLETSSGYPHS